MRFMAIGLKKIDSFEICVCGGVSSLPLLRRESGVWKTREMFCLTAIKCAKIAEREGGQGRSSQNGVTGAAARS